jgi:hypothetical protein
MLVALIFALSVPRVLLRIAFHRHVYARDGQN